MVREKKKCSAFELFGSKIDSKDAKLFEFDSIKNSDESLVDDKYDNLILTMKITLDKNNLQIH